MVQAAARGVVDFSKADVLDRKWWRRLWLMLDQVEQDNALRVRGMQHAHNAAALDYKSGDKAFNTHWEECTNAVTETWNALFPWHVITPDAQNERLRQAWISRYGDPEDPEVRERIRKTAEVMKEMREKALRRMRRAPQQTTRRAKPANTRDGRSHRPTRRG